MSFVQAAASAAIVTLLLTGAATAKPIATLAETNLRKAAGTDSEVLTLIPKGTTVEIGKCSSGWCEASFDGKDGFVIARNVGLAPRADATPRPSPSLLRGRSRRGHHRSLPSRAPYYYRPHYPYGYYYRPWGWGWGWRW